MKIILRLFPSTNEGRRGSLVSREITINKPPYQTGILVKDLIDQYPEYHSSKVRLAHHTQFLKEDDSLQEHMQLNVIPIG